MKKRIFSALLSVAMLLAFTVGCSQEAAQVSSGGGASTPQSEANSSEGTDKTALSGKLLIGGHQRTAEGEPEAYEELARKFNEEYPNIEIEFMWTGAAADGIQNMTTARMAGEQIDLYNISASLINQQIAANGLLMDMTELMKPYEDRFQTGMLNSYTIGGKLWGFPFSSSGTVTFYYNKDMFDELGIEEPSTYDELVEICQVIKEEKDIIPIIQQGQKTNMWPMWFMETFAQSSGNQSEQFTVDFLSGNRKFTEEAEIEAFRLLKQFVDDGLIDSVSFNTDTDGMHAAYSQQKCAMIFGGTWEITRIINNVGDTFETGVFEFPLMVEGAEVQHGSGASIGFAIPSFANPDNIELTMAFVEFLTRPENAEPIIKLSSPIIPSIKGVAPLENPMVEELNGEHSNHLIGYLDWMWPAEITDEVGTNIPAVMNGTITPEEAAANIQTTYDNIVEERAYSYNWWDTWTDDQWAAVTPQTIPASFAE